MVASMQRKLAQCKAPEVILTLLEEAREAGVSVQHVLFGSWFCSSASLHQIHELGDGLHQAAGSKEVLELHGSVHRNYCTKCKKFFPLSYIVESKGIPTCDECGAIIKPDVVLYEEGLDQSILTRSINHIAKADMLIIGGTSLAVYPAAGLIDYFHGKYLVVINMASTPRDSYADIVINGKIGEVLSQIEV